MNCTIPPAIKLIGVAPPSTPAFNDPSAIVTFEYYTISKSAYVCLHYESLGIWYVLKGSPEIGPFGGDILATIDYFQIPWVAGGTTITMYLELVDGQGNSAVTPEVTFVAPYTMGQIALFIIISIIVIIAVAVILLHRHFRAKVAPVT